MAAYRRVYDSRHLQADCQEAGSAPEPFARQSSIGYLYLFSRLRDDEGLSLHAYYIPGNTLPSTLRFALCSPSNYHAARTTPVFFRCFWAMRAAISTTCRSGRGRCCYDSETTALLLHRQQLQTTT